MTNPILKFSEADFICNNIRLYHGDCLDILDKLPPKSVDLIFADPPYNLQLKQELYRPNQTKVDGVDDEWDKFASFAEYDQFTESWLKKCQNLLSDKGTIWVIGSYHNIFRVGKIMMDMGFWILNDVQWYKTNPMPNFKGTRFTNATETLIWAKKSEAQKKYTFNHQVMKQLNDGKQMVSVWQIPICIGNERIKDEHGKKAHSTQKPEELLRRVILSSSSEGDLVLDPFSSSGTTGAVARKLNRKFVGIEREEKYIQIATKRIKAINPHHYQHLNLVEPTKENEMRVSVTQLLEAGLLQIGEIFYSKNRAHQAILQADGNLNYNNPTASIHGNLDYDNQIASIHRMGAIIQSQPSCNGWTYWYVMRGGALLLIDELRKQYREKTKGNGNE
jgi:DNA modification methylase